MVDTIRPPAPTADSSKVMPLLGAALSDVDQRIVDVQGKRDGTVLPGRKLDLLTLGLGTGAAAYALRPGHSNAITNLTFATGASYLASSLFGSNDVASVYQAGAMALSC